MQLRLELTPSRVTFLHGDLGFERSKIALLGGISFAEVAEMLRTHGIKRFRGSYWRMSFPLLCTIGKRLDLRFTSKPFLLPYIQRVLRDAVEGSVVRGTLDPVALDALIRDLPALVEQEGLPEQVAARFRDSKSFGGSFPWHQEEGRGAYRVRLGGLPEA